MSRFLTYLHFTLLGALISASPSQALDYKFHAPANADHFAPSRPLIVALHGCKQDAELFAKITRLNEQADRAGMAVLYPEQSIFKNIDHCWNWFLPFNQQRDYGEPSEIVALVRQIAQRYPIDRSRIYVMGISSGGAMANILASCYPDIFSAVAIHSGLEYQASTSMFTANEVLRSGGEIDGRTSGQLAFQCADGHHRRILPAITLHGTEDTRVYPIASDLIATQFSVLNDLIDDGIENESFPHAATHHRLVTPDQPAGYAYRIDDTLYQTKLALRQVTIRGLAHAWSGGVSGFANSDPLGPDATAMIVNFFDTIK